MSGQTQVLYAQERWLAATGWIALSLACLVGLYWETAESIVSIWLRSDTFAHGILIFPISVYLVWRKRAVLARIDPLPDYLGVLVLGALGLVWLIASLVHVQVVQQLTLVAMIPALVLALAGRRVVAAILFPLAFLFFAVPVGEGLVPGMMKFTAAFTVSALQMTGIPVFSDGLQFSIPSGDWNVVEACSGVRYLIASITLGCLYAYLTYRSLWRRLAFIALAMVFPLVANGLRAYMIVMIGHLSGMKLAMGVDHLIYGWLFFGLVILLMFWIGSFWRDDIHEEEDVSDRPVEKPHREQDGASAKFTVVAIASLAVLLVWPVRAHHIATQESGRVVVGAPEAPSLAAGWHPLERRRIAWAPRYVGTEFHLQQEYTRNGQTVGLFLAYYPKQRQDSELVNSQNVMIPQKHPVWTQTDQRQIEVNMQNRDLPVFQSMLKSRRTRILTWHWYWVDGVQTNNDYLAKLLEAKGKLLTGSSEAAGIVVYAPYDEDPGEASQVMVRYLEAMLPSIETSLRAGSKSVIDSP